MESMTFWHRLGWTLTLASAVVLPVYLALSVQSYLEFQHSARQQMLSAMEADKNHGEQRGALEQIHQERITTQTTFDSVFPLLGGFFTGVAMIRQSRKRAEAERDQTPEHLARLNVSRFTATRYATFWPRFWASFLDGFALAPITAFISAGHLYCPPRYAWCLNLLSTIAFYSYTFWLLITRGQTVGKWLCRVKVLDASETPMHAWQPIARDSVPLVLTVVLTSLFLRRADSMDPRATLFFSIPLLGWFLLECITMLSNSKRRALHDFIARTVVVRCAE